MNTRRIKNISITVCLLGVLAAGLLAFRSNTKKAEAEAAWQNKQVEMAAIKKEITEIEQSLLQYEKEKEDFAKLLFKERDIPAFLDKISEFAKTTTVSILDMKTQRFQEVRVPDNLSSTRKNRISQKDKNPVERKKEELKNILTLAAMPIDIKVQGTFTSLVDFLEQLQSYSQLLNISNIQITLSRDYPALSCQFTLRVYSLKTLEELKRI